MPDTKRTFTDLITNLFQDGQQTNQITAQDVRDLIASMVMPCGNCYFEDNASATTINTLNVYEAIAGTYLSDLTTDMTVNAAGLFTYTGTPDRHFHIASSVSLTAAGNSKTVNLKWFKNGSTGLQSKHSRFIATGANESAMAVHADAMLSTNDTLQLKIANATDTTNFTVTNAYCFLMGMFI